PPLPSSPLPATPALYPLSLHDALPICRPPHLTRHSRRCPPHQLPDGRGAKARGRRGPGFETPSARSGCMSRDPVLVGRALWHREDRKSTRLNSSHLVISYAVFCLKKKK